VINRSVVAAALCIAVAALLADGARAKDAAAPVSAIAAEDYLLVRDGWAEDRPADWPQGGSVDPPAGFDNRQRDDAAPSPHLGNDDENRPQHASELGMAGNPAAVNIVVGNGALGRLLGITEESGFRLGGMWLGDASAVLSGGVDGGEWGLNNLAIIDLSLDAEKRWGWEGTSFGTQFLDYTGQPTNSLAGTVQGFDGVQASKPFNRSELYQLWWRQTWFDGALITRLGKSVPSFDFNNVLSAVPVGNDAANIPAVTSLIYTPIFVNPTMYGRLPGYYDSATGLTMTLTPTETTYASYGVYDGSAAHGEHTGLLGPQFDGYYFNIAEVGTTWLYGPEGKPGKLGVGLWHQTGDLRLPSGGVDDGENGVYLFASQRLWFQQPGVNHNGVSGFLQYGANDSDSSWVRQYFGAGLTAFGLVSSRPNDSQGVGMAWSFLNDDPNAGHFFFPGAPGPSTALNSNELMFAGYYQAALSQWAFLQPTLTYIPNPGSRPDIPAAFASSIYLTILF
jgi:porin